MTNWLFSFGAARVKSKITPKGSVTFNFQEQNSSTLTAFSDRPERIKDQFRLKYFARKFSSAFKDSNPNASMTYWENGIFYNHVYEITDFKKEKSSFRLKTNLSHKDYIETHNDNSFKIFSKKNQSKHVINQVNFFIDSAESLSSTSNKCFDDEETAIYLIPKNWNDQIKVYKKNHTIKYPDISKALASNINKKPYEWGAPTIPAHITMTSYAPPKNSTKHPTEQHHGSDLEQIVNKINDEIIKSSKPYFKIKEENWLKRVDIDMDKKTGKPKYYLIHVSQSHMLNKTMDLIKKDKLVRQDKNYSVSNLHVSFREDFNPQYMAEFLSDIEWEAVKMCAKYGDLAETAKIAPPFHI